MALTKCPECSQAVSDQAVTCPHCGYPFKPHQPPAPGDLEATVKETLLRQGKIAAIKHYREVHPFTGLAEAKAYIDQLAATIPPDQIGTQTPRGCLSIIAVAGFLVAGCLLLLLWIRS